MVNIKESNFNKVAQSQTLFINQICADKEERGETVYKYGFGQSPFSPPKHIIDELGKHLDNTKYLDVQGLRPLREAVAEFHSTNKVKLSSDNVFVGAGSKILIYGIMASFKNAEILLPAPCWVSYEPQAELLKHNVTYIRPTYEKRYRIDSKDIREVLESSNFANDAQKILILTYPGNPDGLTYSSEELQDIANECKKHNILVISDEIYGLLTYNNKHQTIIDHYPEGTIVTTGLSKWCAAGGWRLGVCFYSDKFNEDFKLVLKGFASETYSCVTSPIQYAAIEAYKENPEMDEFIAKEIKILEFLSNACFEKFIESGVKVHQGQGGFYLFLNFSNFADRLKAENINNDIDLCGYLLNECGVALLPGSAFGMDSKDYTARFAFVDFDGNAAIEDFDGKFSDEYKQKHFTKMLKGVDILCEFLNS